MDTERVARETLRKKGTEEFANQKIKNYKELLGHAAEDIGDMTGSSKKANQFIESAVSVIANSERQVRMLKRPDLYQEKPVTRRRSFLIDGFKK